MREHAADDRAERLRRADLRAGAPYRRAVQALRDRSLDEARVVLALSAARRRAARLERRA